jgi:hypothetical protein
MNDMSVDIDSPEIQAAMRRAVSETNRAFRQRQSMNGSWADYEDWYVSLPHYDANGVLIERFEVTQEEANLSKLRAAFNRQRGDRSLETGWYTRLKVDGVLWMTDTPAEIRDHERIDALMAESLIFGDSSLLIVGLGLGMVLQRAIAHHRVPRIDVIEVDQRVIDAVGPHYHAMAKAQDVALGIWQGDIRDFRPPKGSYWDLGYFDIWSDINSDDMAEVELLRKRWWRRLGKFEAWAQKERVAQKRRVASGKWAY